MISSNNPLEKFLSSSSSLSSSMTYTDLLNTTFQQSESDLPPLEKLPPVTNKFTEFTNFDSNSSDLNDEEWLCTLLLGNKECVGGGVDATGDGDGGEEMDSLVRVSSNAKVPPPGPGIVSGLEDTVQEPNVSPMEELVGAKTTHLYSADTEELRVFTIEDLEDELDELDESLCKKKRKTEIHDELKGQFEDLVKKLTKKQEDEYKLLLDMIEQKERNNGKRWRRGNRKEEETRAQDTQRNLEQQEINTPQSTRQQIINVPQSPEINLHDQSGQEKRSSKKWPKHELQALISLRMAVEQKLRTGATKFRMWEKISLGMASMGFSRTAKHCQDKWENMTMCFKKAEGSGKTRAENAKTHQYFQELDMFYKIQRLEGSEYMCDASYKRWTKNEAQALISLKMAMGQEFPMSWEDISRGMASKGFTKTAIQCINKWKTMTICFKKAERSGKTWEDNAKTCPYFRELDMFYKKDLTSCKKKRKREIHDELKGQFEDLVNKLTKKQEDEYKLLLEKQDNMYKVLLDKIEQKEGDRIMIKETGKNLERKEEERRAQDTQRNLGHQEINTPQSTRQEVINILQSPEINLQDQSGQKKQRYKEWPKHELQALISLRMAIEQKLRTAGATKYRMWEEISLGMASMGFTRNAKHCQDKWDFMTMCFKKAEGNGKTRAENAETLAYFQELDMFYKKQRLEGSEDMFDASYKRWTKHEARALISLKMAVDQKYPMSWEDISRGMASKGFFKTATQCVNKWNNMTSCFKKAETCPYYQELDMFYKKGLTSYKNAPVAETETSLKNYISTTEH